MTQAREVEGWPLQPHDGPAPPLMWKNLLFFSPAKLEATSSAGGTETVISGIVVGSRWVGETSKTTSLALHSSGNLPGDIPSSIRGERKVMGKMNRDAVD